MLSTVDQKWIRIFDRLSQTRVPIDVLMRSEPYRAGLVTGRSAAANGKELIHALDENYSPAYLLGIIDGWLDVYLTKIEKDNADRDED